MKAVPERLMELRRRLARGVKVLVVDDDPHDRDALTRLLATSEMFSVETAADGAAALAAMQSRPFEVVFLDLIMPGMSGLDVLRQAGELSAFIVVVTGLDANAPDVLEAIRLGACKFVPKPVTKEALEGLL